MVRAYVFRKTESRCGIKWEDFKDKRNAAGQLDVPEKYREAREKVCTGAFLAIRSRHSREDFVSYFTGTICSVPQFLPESEYDALAESLLTDKWEEVKSLSMLALSGLSRV
jgi:CRISPR-associated protein Cmx8